MITDIDLVTLIVDDQEAAKNFYVEKLGFELHQEEAYGDGERWIEIAPMGSQTRITIKTPEMFDAKDSRHRRALIGASPQITYRVDDCERVYQSLKGQGVSFDDEPKNRSWGISAVARDPSGNPVVFTEV